MRCALFALLFAITHCRLAGGGRRGRSDGELCVGGRPVSSFLPEPVESDDVSHGRTCRRHQTGAGILQQRWAQYVAYGVWAWYRLWSTPLRS